MRTHTALEIVGDTYMYPTHAWEDRREAAIGRRKLLRILYYLRTGRQQRRESVQKVLDKPEE